MWGDYADGHKGVCLIFNVINEGENLIIQGFRKLTKVKYTSKLPELNFFENISYLPDHLLNSHWLEYNGKYSSLNEYYANADDFQAKYWKTFSQKNNIKLIDWNYQKEYRTLAYPFGMSDLQEHDKHLKYGENSLKGIIFGARTPLDTKWEILKVIEDKLEKRSNKNFEFYQARFSNLSSKLEIIPLTFIKWSKKI